MGRARLLVERLAEPIAAYNAAFLLKGSKIWKAQGRARAKLRVLSVGAGSLEALHRAPVELQRRLIDEGLEALLAAKLAADIDRFLNAEIDGPARKEIAQRLALSLGEAAASLRAGAAAATGAEPDRAPGADRWQDRRDLS